MNCLPDRFAETSLLALPEAERPALVHALLEGEAARGLRLRPSAPAEMAGDGPPVPWARYACYLPTDSTAGGHVLHAAGAYYLQEPSAMAAVAALDVRPGQRVLDLCAAPGGKATQIAGLLAGEGVLVANEIVPQRARVLSRNVERMGVVNAIVTNEQPGRLAARWAGGFDRVLVDAPCSGEGMFRREPDSRAQWTPQSPTGCAARQAQILDAAAALVRPGGLMVYSTCTFNTIENEDTVAAFLTRHANFAAEDFALPGVGASAGGCLRLWPHRLRGEGHFVARLRRAGEGDTPSPGVAVVRLPDVDETFGAARFPGRLDWAGDRLWLLPHGAPPLDGVRALRTGLALGERRGGRFLPGHAAAMALPPGQLARCVEIGDAQAARFLRGETIDAPGAAPGWTAVAYRGLSLGWGKVSGGVLKNHLPKGLRL